MVKILPSNAVGMGLIPSGGLRSHVPLPPKKQNIKLKQYCNKFSKDSKNDPYQKDL